MLRRAIIDRDVFIPRGARIGFDAEEDRRRHTVSDRGIVVVTKDDEPFIGPISEDALRNEAEFDASGSDERSSIPGAESAFGGIEVVRGSCVQFESRR